MKSAERLDNESNSSTTITTKKRRRPLAGCRTVLFFSVVLLSCLSVCALVLGFAWAGGYAQDTACDLVLEDSELAKRLECKAEAANVKVEEPDSDVPVKVIDEPASSNGNIDVAGIYNKTSAAVVGIGIKGDTSSDQVIGSGFVVSENGLIATNQHVVSVRNASYFIKFEGNDELVEVKEIFRDSSNDIAVLRVDKKNLPALTLGNSDKLSPGQPVVAIGNPLGEFASTVTSGIISGLNREVRIGESFLRTDVREYENTIQTDAAINPGNSGGPLLDASGNVIGINFATVQGYENLSFAIPVNTLRLRLDELREFGKFRIPYLGLEYRTRLVAVGQEVLVGAQVLAVDEKGGAAGVLQRGDIIVEFAGKSLEEESLFELIQATKINSEVKLVIIRNNERQTVTVKIVERS